MKSSSSATSSTTSSRSSSPIIGIPEAAGFFTHRLFRPTRFLFNFLLAVCFVYYLFVLFGNHRSSRYYDKKSLIRLEPSDSTINSSISQGERPVTNDANELKRILFWTGYYERKDMIFGFGQRPFIEAGCQVTNCWATDDRSELNRSDAIIFHGVDFKANDLPNHRKPNQKYIFYIFETLINERYMPVFNAKITDNYFNWTMTHRRDSDIYIAAPYGALRRKGESLKYPNQLPPYLPQDSLAPLPKELMLKSRITKRFAKKTKMVAWFCSNTITPGRREDYVQELAKHVQMEVYGKCGNMTCQPRNSPQCDSLLDNYKFYFSAENSLCPDYVTEKFYRALEADVVPIVYGGADYAQYAPPHSYIHVADFASPKELSNYLHFLASNEAMYNKYFDWKKEWEVVKSPLNGWCDLCAKLNDPESSKETKVYESISKWWYDDIPCYPGSSYIETVLNKFD